MAAFLPAASAGAVPRQRTQQPDMRRPPARTAKVAALGDLRAAEALRDDRLGKAGERRQDRLGQDVQPAGIGGFRIRSFQLSCFDFHISNIIEI